MSTSAAISRPALSRRELLFTLWVFVMFLYLYCDVLGLFDPVVLNQLIGGGVGGFIMTEMFLVAAGALMILLIAMVLLTRVLARPAARIGNIVVGAIKTLVMIATLLTPCTLYYWMFAVIEIATTVSIVALAWTWRSDAQ